VGTDALLQAMGERAHAKRALELIREVLVRSAERMEEEAADVLYHLFVLLRSRGRVLAHTEQVLDERSR
jgi:phosphoribosyl-ATP pyrophosphohydrolase/phosphoribosyl-AMP cyclohydrolase